MSREGVFYIYRAMPFNGHIRGKASLGYEINSLRLRYGWFWATGECSALTPPNTSKQKNEADLNSSELDLTLDVVINATAFTDVNLVESEPDKAFAINKDAPVKLAGEEELANHKPDALIIRTSWLYGPNGHCFPKAIINKLNQNEQLSVVDDQFGTPTSTWFLRD